MPKLNRLLAALSSEDLATVTPYLEEVALSEKQVLFEYGDPIRHVYFVRRGIIFFVFGDPPTGLWSHGPEGFSGVPLFLGSSTLPARVFVQAPGSAFRIESDNYLRLVENIPDFRRICSLYVMSLLSFAAQVVTCTRIHTLEQRCASQLLIMQGQAQEKTFPLTQEQLAMMLGVRRPTVSLVIGGLQRENLIVCGRGSVTIADRKGLEKVACSCLSVVGREYERQLQHECSAQERV